MAYPYRSILSPISFDDLSLLALGYAKRLAADSGATLHLLNVIDRFPGIGQPEVTEEEHTLAEEAARARLAAIAHEHLAGLSYQIHMADAPPQAVAKAVVQVAAEVDADLIVLKTHGRTGLSHLLLGSVAEAVLRTAPCPVLTLTPAAQAKASHMKLLQP